MPDILGKTIIFLIIVTLHSCMRFDTWSIVKYTNFHNSRFHVLFCRSFLFFFRFNLQRSMFLYIFFCFLFAIRYSWYNINCTLFAMQYLPFANKIRHKMSRMMTNSITYFSKTALTFITCTFSVHLSLFLFLFIKNLCYAPINVFIFNFFFQFLYFFLHIEYNRVYCIHLGPTIQIFTFTIIYPRTQTRLSPREH